MTPTLNRPEEDSILSQSELNLTEDLRAYVSGHRRDSKLESTLLRRVQALPQAQRFEILLPLLELDMRMALLLIGSAQLSQAAYLQVFNEGLVKTPVR